MAIKRLKIKKGDTVRIMAGKNKGVQGEVTQVFPDIEKVVVEKANITKKHLRPQRQGEQGQVIEYSAPIHVSNVQIVDPESGKPTRVGYTRTGEDKKKMRIAKKSGSSLS